MKKEEIFSSVVENAFDFFDKSLKEFDEKQFKYSVIHFCAAVELFLKARLLCEHWTLVLPRNKEPNLDEFIAGKAHSAILDEIKKRLKSVVQDGLSQRASDAFDRLAKHRNQVIHFCHPTLLKKNIPQIVGEQCRAWHYLQELLTMQWEKYFKKYADQIKRIDARIKRNREYLREKFKLVKSQIDADVTKRIYYHTCPICEFKALRFLGETPHLFSTRCLVCDYTNRAVQIDCPSCSKKVTFVGEGFTTCSCGKKLDSNDLFEVMFDHRAAYVDYKDGGDSFRRGNCCECDTSESVIPYYEEYLCLNCLQTFSSMYCCQWCNDPQTDEAKDSYLCGCQFCDGKFGDIKDD